MSCNKQLILWSCQITIAIPLLTQCLLSMSTKQKGAQSKQSDIGAEKVIPRNCASPPLERQKFLGSYSLPPLPPSDLLIQLVNAALLIPKGKRKLLFLGPEGDQHPCKSR